MTLVRALGGLEHWRENTSGRAGRGSRLLRDVCRAFVSGGNAGMRLRRAAFAVFVRAHSRAWRDEDGDEDIVMTGGVMSWHDLALYLIARYVGPVAAQAMARITHVARRADRANLRIAARAGGASPYRTRRWHPTTPGLSWVWRYLVGGPSCSET
jgi:hypothetical protein